jgi:hypothetical protein
VLPAVAVVEVQLEQHPLYQKLVEQPHLKYKVDKALTHPHKLHKQLGQHKSQLEHM